MTGITTIQKLLSDGNGMFTSASAVQSGVHRQQLARGVTLGILERAERGIYISPGGLDDMLFWMQQRARKIIYSHETALFLHHMTDRTPIRYSITVPSSYKASPVLKKYCKINYIKQELIDLGKTEMPSGMGNSIVTYNTERTLCDIIRSRNKIDNQIVIEALKNYARHDDKDLNRLYQYAEYFQVDKIIHQYLEVLL
jgi:predicted transcriptional regulator of viral defense system